jgi:hypothetical protein
VVWDGRGRPLVMLLIEGALQDRKGGMMMLPEPPPAKY